MISASVVADLSGLAEAAYLDFGGIAVGATLEGLGVLLGSLKLVANQVGLSIFTPPRTQQGPQLAAVEARDFSKVQAIGSATFFSVLASIPTPQPNQQEE